MCLILYLKILSRIAEYVIAGCMLLHKQSKRV